MEKDKKYSICCVGCGRVIEKTVRGNKNSLWFTCKFCGTDFTIKGSIAKDKDFIIELSKYTGKISGDWELKDKDLAYPAIFCPFNGMTGKTVLLSPKSNYKFQCQNEDCKKTFEVIVENRAFNS